MNINMVRPFTVCRKTLIEEIDRFVASCGPQIARHELDCTAGVTHFRATSVNRIEPVEITLYIHRNGARLVGHVFRLEAAVIPESVHPIVAASQIDKILNVVEGLMHERLSASARMPNGPVIDSAVVRTGDTLADESLGVQTIPVPPGLHNQRDAEQDAQNLLLILQAARQRFRESALAVSMTMFQFNRGKTEVDVPIPCGSDHDKITIAFALRRRGFDVRLDSKMFISEEGNRIGIINSLIVTRSTRPASIKPYAIDWSIADVDVTAKAEFIPVLRAAIAQYGHYLNDAELIQGVIDRVAV